MQPDIAVGRMLLFVLAASALVFPIQTAWGQGFDEVKEYIDLRDELSAVKDALQKGLTEEPGSTLLKNPDIESALAGKLVSVENRIRSLSLGRSPLSTYYQEKLRSQLNDCRVLFPHFVRRMALGLRQAVASAPNSLGMPVPRAIPQPPVTFVIPKGPAIPTVFATLASTPAASPAAPLVETSVPVQALPPGVRPPENPYRQLSPQRKREYFRQRKAYFQPIGGRISPHTRIIPIPKPPLVVASNTPPKPATPPGAHIPLSAGLGVPRTPKAVPPVQVASAPLRAVGPIPPRPPAPGTAGLSGPGTPPAIVPVTAASMTTTAVKPPPKASFSFPTLPPPLERAAATITPLQPWNGKDPQIRETPGMRPLAIMIENHNQARPQTGLEEAEAVFEIPVEGGITRFMALFYHVLDKVGPVRSCREYFVDRALEVNPLYVHCGGSPSGYKYLGESKVFAIDEISNGKPFFRDMTRKAPHNLYTRAQSLIDVMNLKFPMQLPYQKLPVLYGESPTVSQTPCNGVAIRYHGNYTTAYVFNPRRNQYDRYMNGQHHIDRVTSRPVSVGTVVVQEALMKVVDDKGRQDIDFIGNGRAWILARGTVFPCTWRKTAPREFTRFFDLQGRQVVFSNKGSVWFQVVSPQEPVVFSPPLPVLPTAIAVSAPQPDRPALQAQTQPTAASQPSAIR